MFLRTESFGQFIRFYPIITIIIAIHIAIFLAMQLPFLPHNWILESLAGVNILIERGEYWRLFTPIIVHAGFSHLLFNSFSLVLFGPALERALGKITFILVYIASGIRSKSSYLIYKTTLLFPYWCERCNFWFVWYLLGRNLFEKRSHAATRQTSYFAHCSYWSHYDFFPGEYQCYRTYLWSNQRFSNWMSIDSNPQHSVPLMLIYIQSQKTRDSFMTFPGFCILS